MSDINQENLQKKPKERSRGKSAAIRLAQCAIFVVLMVVSAYIQIPFPFVPLTFQTVVAVLAGLLLGPRYGTASVCVYVLMGLLGLPVFSGGGGIGYVVQLTFGYLLGFIAATFVSGFIAHKCRPSLRIFILAGVCGFLANYAVGAPYFLLLWHFYYHNAGLWNAFVVYNLIYMPKDLILCILAAVLANRLIPLLDRR